MFANGVANLLGSVSSSYPVSGSFSRSALNAACGARTPLSIIVNIIGVIVVLTRLTDALQYIPQAALAAVIFVAIANLLHFKDFWHAWKYSKKDFFTGLVTLIFSFVFDTSIGLAIGLGTSILMYIVFDIILSKTHQPRLFSSSRAGLDVDVVRIESDLNFLTAARIKDFISALTIETPAVPDISDTRLMYSFIISSAFDKILKPQLLRGVDKLPKAIVIDMCLVKTVDISGLEALQTAMSEARSKKVLVALININPEIGVHLSRFGITSDKSSDEINFKTYEDAYRMDLWTIQHRQLANRRERTVSEIERMGDLFTEVELPQVGEHEVDITLAHDRDALCSNDDEEDAEHLEGVEMQLAGADKNATTEV
jgi:MFS superfamily sulfate permease-like transporter